MGGAVKRQPAGQQFVEDDAEGIDIAAGVGGVTVAGRLLGRHVRQRAENVAVGGRRAGRLRQEIQPGQAEIEDVRPAVGVDEDVARLEIAMTDALPVGMLDRLGDAGDEIDHLGDAGARAAGTTDAARRPRRTP